MGGMMGGMGGGSSSGGSAQAAYQPQAQAEADTGYQNLLRPMYSQGLAGIQGLGDVSPAGQAWPGVQAATQGVLNNPYANQMVQGGQTAYDFFNQGVLPNVYQGSQRLADIANTAYGQSGNAFAAANNPNYAAANAAGYNLSGPMQGAGMQLLGDAFNPNYQRAIEEGNLASARQFAAGGDIRNTAFDPQNALRNRTMSRLTDRLGASLANQGLAGTPYGGGVLGNALSNAGIDWENNLLQRQIQGGQAASGLDTQGIEQRLRPALATTQAGVSDIAGAGGAFQSALASLLTPANAAMLAQSTGATTLGNLANTASGGYSGANQLLQQAAQGENTYAGLPYTNLNAQQQANQGALQNMITLGNQNYAIPQTVLNDLQSYLKLGQSGSELGNQIGTTNFNQTAQGIGGLANLGSGLLGGSGSGGLGGLGSSLGSALGLGGGAAAGGWGATPLLAGGLGEAGAGAASAGIGETLASAAPMALSL